LSCKGGERGEGCFPTGEEKGEESHLFLSVGGKEKDILIDRVKREKEEGKKESL